MKLIVGLGNPGSEYDNTRHNVGFIILDNYLQNENWLEKDNYLYVKKIINNEDVIFIKPLTYMNLSGNAVRKVVSYYKICLSDILIIHDDMDLPLDKYRIKYKSSSGGHNGIKSIIECLGSNEFCRLKIGIGKNKYIDTKNYVLGKLSKAELTIIKNNIYNEIIDCFITDGIDKCMNKYNK